MTHHGSGAGAGQEAPVARYQMYIDGNFVDAQDGKTFDVYDPATEEVIATCPAGDAKDVDRAAKAATKAFYEGWKSASPRRSEVASSSAWPSGFAPGGPSWPSWRPGTTGKPIAESEFDMDDTATCFEYYGGLATKINGEVAAGSRQRDGLRACASRWAWPARSSPGTIRC